MRVGIDIDGILAQFDEAFLARVIKHTGRDLFGEGFVPRTWDYPEAAGYTDTEMTAIWDDIKQCPVWWETLPPYPDTAVILTELHKRMAIFDDSIYFITSRVGHTAKHQTERWLRAKNTLNMSRQEEFRPTVLISHQKGRIAKALELEAFIDDKPFNVLNMPTAVRTYMLRRPWNEEEVERVTLGGVIVVESVGEMFRDLGW